MLLTNSETTIDYVDFFLKMWQNYTRIIIIFVCVREEQLSASELFSAYSMGQCMEKELPGEQTSIDIHGDVTLGLVSETSSQLVLFSV